ncbi:sigma-70 family RNA polymerase sigma factor [Mammaliicoccus sciuri]|uniref:sigma factor-like helix-turn-helix DNA-binding protein n=1 Tax=Mammaliicoccus sciuri TaxID=1296 RepID=UPI002DB6A01B|nr:sigma factor-like helix-turn-helix DNA-binding protein [Mammaliicoccus sciuri]MEB5791468.1 sigma-70 family RNA polymerase sigma factor [Mammaliicoccus sciuri]
MFEWLKLYRDLDMQHKALELKRDISKEEIDRWYSISYTRADLGKKQDMLSRVRQVDRIREELEELNERIERIERQKNKVLELIDRFEGIEHKILRKKYIDDMTLQEIAYDLGYSEQYIRKKHAECIKRIDFINS